MAELGEGFSWPGSISRKSAVCAARSARSEAGILGLNDVAAGQFGHAAADLAWAAIYVAAGEHEKALALIHAARERLAAPLGTAAVAQSCGGLAPREPESRRGPEAAGEREGDPATHARLLIERYGPTVAAEMTALYAEMTGTEHWRSAPAKIGPRTAR